MSNYRLRAEGELLVLQIGEYEKRNRYTSYEDDPKLHWRDASLTDIPLGEIFPSRIPEGHVLLPADVARSLGLDIP